MEKIKYTLRAEQEKLKKMKITAIEKDMNLNDLIVMLFDKYIEEEVEKNVKN